MTLAYDAIIIGAGQAGPPLAGRLTAAGMSVALIERKLFGGTCVNTGCIPTKTLVASAYAAHLARRAAEYGITLGGPVAVDMKAVKARKDAVSMRSRTGVQSWLRAWSAARSIAAMRASCRRARCRWATTGSPPSASSSMSGGRALVPDMPGSIASAP